MLQLQQSLIVVSKTHYGTHYYNGQLFVHRDKTPWTKALQKSLHCMNNNVFGTDASANEQKNPMKLKTVEVQSSDVLILIVNPCCFFLSKFR